METLTTIKDLVQTLGGAGTIGVLVLFMIVMRNPDVLDRIVKRNQGAGDGGTLHDKMDHLTEHYNDETTLLLSDIRDGINKLNDSFGKQADSLKDAHTKLDNIEKYGLPCRKIN